MESDAAASDASKKTSKGKKEKKEKEQKKAERKKKAAKAKKEEEKKKTEETEKKRKAEQERKEAAARKEAKLDEERIKKTVPELKLSLEDVSEEEADGDGPYADWPHPNRVVFAKDVQDAQLASEATNKKDKLTLSCLVSVMDNIPETILKHHQLDDILDTLQKMERLPKKEKVEMILGSLQALADAANAKLPPPETPKETRTPTEEAPGESESEKEPEAKDREEKEKEEKEDEDEAENAKEE